MPSLGRDAGNGSTGCGSSRGLAWISGRGCYETMPMPNDCSCLRATERHQHPGIRAKEIDDRYIQVANVLYEVAAAAYTVGWKWVSTIAAALRRGIPPMAAIGSWNSPDAFGATLGQRSSTGRGPLPAWIESPRPTRLTHADRTRTRSSGNGYDSEPHLFARRLRRDISHKVYRFPDSTPTYSAP